MNPKSVIEKTGGVLSQENSLIFPVLRNYYLRGYRVILPANLPSGEVKGLLFCRPMDGKVSGYNFWVHFRLPFREVCVVVKNYLDFIALSEIADELEFTPVLTAGSIRITSRIWNLRGFKVDRPDYGRFLVLPVEERGGLWKLKERNPSRFRERFLDLIESASELDEDLMQFRLNQE